MKLVEGTHYRRRLDQPSPHLARSKEVVDCMFCRLPSDSEDEGGRAKIRRKQAKDDIRLDKLLQHFKKNHKGDMPSEGMSLLDMGFTRDVGRDTAQLSHDSVMELEEEGGPSTATPPMQHLQETVAARTTQPPPRHASTTPISVAIAELDRLPGTPFWRSLT